MNIKIKNLLLVPTILFCLFLSAEITKADDITYTVDNVTTTEGQACLDGVPNDCSFKSALELTNAYPNPETDKVTINFDPAVYGQTLYAEAYFVYTLSRSNVEIAGPGVDNFAIDFTNFIRSWSDWGSGFVIAGNSKDATIGNITITNFKVINGSRYYFLVWLYNVHDVLIDNCEFGNAGYDVLHIGEYSDDVIVQNTEIYGADYLRTAPGATASVATGLCGGVAENSDDFYSDENANYRDCLPKNITIDHCYLHDANPEHSHYIVHGGFNLKVLNSTFDMNSFGTSTIVNGFEVRNNTFTGSGGNLYISSNPSSVVEGEVVTNPTNYIIADNTILNGNLMFISNPDREEFFEGLEISNNTINGDLIINGEAENLVIDNNTINEGSITLKNITSFSGAQVINNTISNFLEYGISVLAKSYYLGSSHKLSFNGVDYDGLSPMSEGAEPGFFLYFISLSNIIYAFYDNTVIDSDFISEAKSRGGVSAALINIYGYYNLVMLLPKGLNATDLASCETFASGLWSTCHAFKYDYFNYNSETDEFEWTGLDDFETSVAGDVTLYPGNPLLPPHFEDDPYIREVTQSTGITFSGNTLQDSNGSIEPLYFSSFHPLAYDGINYVNNPGGSGGDVMFYLDNTATTMLEINEDGTQISSNIADEGKSADGFMAILITLDLGSGSRYVSVLLPKNALGVSDLSSCEAVMSAAYGGTCEAFKYNYFDYNEDTEDFTFTGFGGFETDGGAVTLATGYSGDPYIDKTLDCAYAAYRIEGADNTFTNETISNVGNGFYFTNTGVSNNINDPSIGSTCQFIKQIKTKLPYSIDTYYSSLHPLLYNGVEYNESENGTIAVMYQAISDTINIFPVNANDTELDDAGIILPAKGAGGFMVALVDFGGTANMTLLAPKNLLGISDLATCNTVVNDYYGGSCMAFKYDYFDYDEDTEEFIFNGFDDFETSSGGDVSVIAGYTGNPYIRQEGESLTNSNYVNNTIFDEESLTIESGTIEVSYDVQVKVTDQSGVAVSSASVAAEDSEGSVTSLGSTDLSGLTALTLLKVYALDSTGVSTDYNPYTFIVNHSEFLERVNISEILQSNPEIIFKIGATFGGLSLVQYYMENPTLGEAPGQFTVEFNIGDTVDGIPIGGQIMLTFPDAFVLSNNPDIKSHISTFTDDGVDISANITEASVIDNIVTISISNQDIEKQSIVLITLDSDIISQNPTQSGDYYVQMTTKDPLGATLDTGYIPVSIGSDLSFQVNVLETIIMDINDSSIVLNLDPGVNNGEDYSEKTEITIQSNSRNGYVIQAMIDNGKLVNGTYSINGGNAKTQENTIGYIAYNNSGSDEINKTKSELQTDASVIYGLSGTSTNLRLYDGTENAIGLLVPTEGQKHTIYYAVNIDYNIAPGLYSGDVVFTAVPRF